MMIKVLIADDDNVTRKMLVNLLTKFGCCIVEAKDGYEAWKIILADKDIKLLLLDWEMPGFNGVDIIEKIRTTSEVRNDYYCILITARKDQSHIIEGLEIGADDYITKPFNKDELNARLKAAERILNLQCLLNDRVKELELALTEVKELKGLLPTCAYCRKVRNDDNYWEQMELYVAQRTEATFSHGICPDCYEEEIKKIKKEKK